VAVNLFLGRFVAATLFRADMRRIPLFLAGLLAWVLRRYMAADMSFIYLIPRHSRARDERGYECRQQQSFSYSLVHIIGCPPRRVILLPFDFLAV
jgi:hypothetical protein